MKSVLWLQSVALALTLILLVAVQGFSQEARFPATFRYSTTLPTPELTAVEGGGYQAVSVTFRIYALADDTDALFTERFVVTPDTHGRVSLMIGSTQADGLPVDLFAKDEARWVSLQFGESAESSRAALISVPYALKARDTETFGGHPLSNFILAAPMSVDAGDNNERVSSTGSATYSASSPATINNVPKYIDAYTLGGSQISDSGLGVGIGGSSPQEMLDVSGRIVTKNSTRGAAGIWFGSNDPAVSPFFGFTSASAGASVGLTQGNQWRLVVQPDGKVGIGTANPTSTLEVKGDVKINGGVLKFADGSSLASAPVSSTTTISAADGSLTVSRQGTNISLAVAPNGIDTSKIADGSITASKFAPGAITLVSGATLGSNTFVGSQKVTSSASEVATIGAENTSTTGFSEAIYASTASTGGIGIKAYASASTGNADAIRALTNAVSGIGTYSEASSTNGINYGMFGLSRSDHGVGVQGQATNMSGTNYGVYGSTSGANYSAGVYGIAAQATAPTLNYGVYGISLGAYGIGAVGYASNATLGGKPIGIVGKVDSPTGTAGWFVNSSTAGDVIVAANYKNKVWRVDNAGNVFTNGTMHTGGADFAESVTASGDIKSYEPGDVLVIDQANDRQVERCAEPYSTRVVGVYATKPGILGGSGVDSSLVGEVPVAMIGIVPVKATAENGAIHRGDLLVTSSTAGFVMKGTDRQRIAGAIVGKAMQSLESGTGVIEVAVTLQ